MARIDMTEAYLDYLDITRNDPLRVLEGVNLDLFGRLAGIPPFEAADAIAGDGTGITLRYGTHTLRLEGSDLPLVDTPENFAAMIAQGTGQGTLSRSSGARVTRSCFRSQ